MRYFLGFVSISIAFLFSCSERSTDVSEASDEDNEQFEVSKGHKTELSSQTQAVIYGDDSRQEFYELDPADIMRDRAIKSTGLLVRPSLVSIQGQRVLLSGDTLGEAQNLCPEERFREQLEPGFCSGTLIDSDLFLTAGHCVDDQADCDNTRIVFRSLYTSPNEIYPTTVQDLYSCAEIITRRNDSGGDYAVIRLDRATSGGLEPAPVWSSTDPLAVGTAITLIGGPNGIPIKTDKQGRVISSGSSSRITFGLSVDAFGGNSGSGLYSEDGQVVGILVQGRTDYFFDQNSNCRRVAQVDVNGQGIPLDDQGGETGTYVSRALAALCPLRPDTLACGGEGSGMTGGEMMGGEMMGGEMMGGGGTLACADAQEEDDSQARAADVVRDSFMLYNYCDDPTDWSRIEVEAGDRLDFETYSPAANGLMSIREIDTVLSVHDLNGTLIAEDDDGGSGRASRLQSWVAPSAGVYGVKVRSYGSVVGEDLNYRLLVRQACEEDEFEQLNAFLSSNDPRSQLQDDRPLSETLLNPNVLRRLPLSQGRVLCDEDWIPFEIVEDELQNSPSIEIQTLINVNQAERVDTILTLYGPNGEQIAQNDDRASNDRSSYIELNLAPGDAGIYWVRVSAYQDLYSGTRPYQLSLSFTELCDDLDNDLDGVIDEGLVNCLSCEPDLYEDNDSFNEAVGFGLGYLTEVNHCLDASDYYRFNLQGGQRIDIETYIERRSDTIVTLFSSGGEILAANDDRAENQLGSIIEDFTAPFTNTYRLLVEQFNRRIGPERPYRLLVREHCTPDELEHDDLATEARMINLMPGESFAENATLCDPDWRRVTLERGQWLDLELIADRRDLSRSINLTVSRAFGTRRIANLSTAGFPNVESSIEAGESGDYWFLVEPNDLYYGGDLEYRLVISPRALDLCDGLDNDQDGETDEGTLNACGGCGQLPVESCNGADDDCDGLTDEGTLNACGQCGELPIEQCNGQDEDCDGVVDEGTLNACGQCGELSVEMCNGQDEDCDGRIDEGTLNACGECGELPIESCNGADEDCDGRVDEGTLNACGECGVLPELDGCDDQDNDCDGMVDEQCEMSAGEISAGEMSAGEMSAGEMSAGMMSAGEMSAGEMSAGTTDDVTVIIGGNREEIDVIEGGETLLSAGDEGIETDRGGSASGCTSHHLNGRLDSRLPVIFWLLLGLALGRKRWIA